MRQTLISVIFIIKIFLLTPPSNDTTILNSFHCFNIVAHTTKRISWVRVIFGVSSHLSYWTRNKTPVTRAYIFISIFLYSIGRDLVQ